MEKDENTTISDELNNEVLEEEKSQDNIDGEGDSKESKSDDKILELEGEVTSLKGKCDEYLELLKRSRAEFDNYRKRTNKEKDSMYGSGFSDAIKEIIPVLDNLERAIETIDTENKGSFEEGVEMVLKLFRDSLNKAGVEEIKAVNEKFDPNYHNAVMHVEDSNYGENTVIEVFQKGYKYKDIIIRYSMVKVAN